MLSLFVAAATSLIPVPKRVTGVHFGPADPLINVELFFDAVCPDCATIWPIIEQVLSQYPNTVGFQVHFIDLPSHTWAYAVSRAVFAVQSVSDDLARSLIRGLLGNHEQDQFTASALKNTPESQVIPKILTYVSTAYNVDYNVLNNKYQSTDIVLNTRIDFKYSFIKNIPGTPTVFFNGAQTDLNEGSSLADWVSLINSLL
jgi:protein-disulfide isomerase